VLESSIQISGKHSYPSIYRMTQKTVGLRSNAAIIPQ
jgi:hypothetical protein